MSKKSPSLVIALKLQFPFISFKIARENRPLKDEESLAINWVMWFWMGMFLFATSIILGKFHNHVQGFEFLQNLLSEFLRDFSIAIILAALVAKMIEVPNLINFVNGRTIEALSDYGFLNGLGDTELDKIKKKCSKIIFEKKGKRDGDQFLNESLIEYESDITSLLLKPYHEYYKINIHCTDVELKDKNGDGFKFVKKVTKRNFKIVNPLRGTAHESILPAVNLFCPNSFDCSNLIELNKIIMETRYIAKSDSIYVQRVSKPTKNFSIHYAYDNPNATLKIEGFGADANLTDGKLIKTENGNAVSFDMLSWLLPGNGIIIVTIPNEKVS